MRRSTSEVVMTGSRRASMLSALLVVILSLLAAGVAAADQDPREMRAQVDWTPDRLTGSVRPGETIATTASFRVSAVVRNASFEFLPASDPDRAPVQVDASRLPARLEAGVRYPIVLRITGPSGRRGQDVNGVVLMRDDGRPL